MLHQCERLYAQVSRAIGKGHPPRLLLTSAVVVVVLFFYVFALGSFLDVGISKLVNRTTALTSFDIHVVDENIDNIVITSGITLLLFLPFGGGLRVLAPIAFASMIVTVGLQNVTLLTPIILISAPVVVLLVLFRIRSAPAGSKGIRATILALSSNYVAITIMALSIISVIISFASYSPLWEADDITAATTSTSTTTDHDYAYQIFILFSASSIVILLLLLGCFPVKLLINELITKRLHNDTQSLVQTAQEPKQRRRIQKLVYLSIFVLLSVILALIPHQPFVNKDNQQIGVDTVGYVIWITELGKSESAGEFLHKAFVVLGNGDRPLSLIFLFALGQLAGTDLAFTFEYLPVILGPILVLVVYFLTRQLTADDTSALMASFLTAVSFHVLVGIFAGYYANWIALIFGYSAFLFLVRFLKTSAVLNLVPFAALMVLLLFSHLYTWTIITIVMAVYLVIMLKMFKSSNYQKKDIILLLVVLALVVVVDITKMLVTNSASGIALDLQIASQGSGFDRFAERWVNLGYTLRSHVGGLFNNFIIFSLALYWLYKSNWRDPSTILIMVFLSIGLLPFLFGDWVVQARVFYDIPFQIPAGIALAYLMKNKGKLLSLSLCVWLVAMAINSVLNFYRVPL